MSKFAGMEASIAAGPIHVSIGGTPFNAPHIEYWKSRALKAEDALAEAVRQRDRYATERDHYRAEKFNGSAR